MFLFLFLIKIKASENPFIIHAENTISVQLTIKYLVTTFKRQKQKNHKFATINNFILISYLYKS